MVRRGEGPESQSQKGSSIEQESLAYCSFSCWFAAVVDKYKFMDPQDEKKTCQHNFKTNNAAKEATLKLYFILKKNIVDFAQYMYSITGVTSCFPDYLLHQS